MQPISQATEDVVTEHEVAALLGLSVRTIQAYRQCGKGPPFHKYGSSRRDPVRYRRFDVIQWRDKHLCTPVLGSAGATP